nr:hypothetical protein CFP56_56414 [Quercus suber]
MGGKVDVVDNCDPDRWSKTEIERICREFGYTSVSMIWYKMLGSDLEMANFHLIVNDDDAMFVTDLVIGHEEIHVFLEHLVDNLILVDKGEHVGADVQPLVVEQNLLGHGSNDDDSNDESSDNSTNGSEDYNNNNEDHIEVDAEQAYSRRESNTPMVEEVDDDDVVEVDAAKVYSRRAGKEPVTQHPSEDKDVVDSSDNGRGDGEGSGLEDEHVVNPDEREFVEDNSDSWDGCDEDVTKPVQMGSGIMNSDYDSEELHSLKESSPDDDIGDDTDDSSEDELKTLFTLNITLGKASKAREKAREYVDGVHTQQYNQLWEYCEELRRDSLGSTILMKVHTFNEGDLAAEMDLLEFIRLYLMTRFQENKQKIMKVESEICPKVLKDCIGKRLQAASGLLVGQVIHSLRPADAEAIPTSISQQDKLKLKLNQA